VDQDHVDNSNGLISQPFSVAKIFQRFSAFAQNYLINVPLFSKLNLHFRAFARLASFRPAKGSLSRRSTMENFIQFELLEVQELLLSLIKYRIGKCKVDIE